MAIHWDPVSAIFKSANLLSILLIVYQKIGDKSDILAIIKPNRGENIVIGAFLTGLEQNQKITGTGESFLFWVETEVESWIWTENCPALFASMNINDFIIGNGALILDSGIGWKFLDLFFWNQKTRLIFNQSLDLKHCSTVKSDIFSSPNLLSKDDSYQLFEVIELELFAFADADL